MFGVVWAKGSIHVCVFISAIFRYLPHTIREDVHIGLIKVSIFTTDLVDHLYKTYDLSPASIGTYRMADDILRHYVEYIIDVLAVPVIRLGIGRVYYFPK